MVDPPTPPHPYFPPYIRRRPRHKVILGLRLRLRFRLELLIRAVLGNVFSLVLAILWSPEVKIIKGHRHNYIVVADSC